VHEGMGWEMGGDGLGWAWLAGWLMHEGMGWEMGWPAYACMRGMGWAGWLAYACMRGMGWAGWLAGLCMGWAGGTHGMGVAACTCTAKNGAARAALKHEK